MILQALNGYYDHLVDSGKLDRLGWESAKVSYALQIDDEGKIVRVVPLLVEEERGKKKQLVPRKMNVPAQVKRASGIAANFLCDNSSYLLGIDAKGKPERSIKCFQASRELHIGLLNAAQGEDAKAVIRFFERWKPERAAEAEVLKPYLEEMMAGANIVFAFRDGFVHEAPEIRAIWDRCYADQGDGEPMRCMVTGEMAPIARLHGSIKGVAGGQAMGVSLVSFNAPAFESFGRDGGQGLNAPVSVKAAFAYVSALNYMIATQGHHMRLSDTTIVFWAESGEDAYASMCAGMMGDALDENDLYHAMDVLAKGLKPEWDGVELDPGEHFYVLGLAPNAARLAVRFFLQDSFGTFARNLWEHQERLKIAKPAFDQRNGLSFWHLLNETVNQKSRDKKPSPLLAGSLVRAVLTGGLYPRLLLDQVELRVRAERNINRGKAAIIKAFLLKNTDETKCKEAVNSMELNENTNYQPYLLGRLFAILENLQEDAAKPAKLNTTIRDRFFNSACATPGVVFPQLLKLAQAHLKKLGGKAEAYYNSRIGEIMSCMSNDFPARLSLYDQGVFQIGYYHQTQARYTKKEEK